jgi:hypothetical protein
VNSFEIFTRIVLITSIIPNICVSRSMHNDLRIIMWEAQVVPCLTQRMSIGTPTMYVRFEVITAVTMKKNVVL